MKSTWKDYLAFSKSDRRAIAILLTIIVGLFAIKYFYHPKKEVPKNDLKLEEQIAQLKNNSASKDSLSKTDEWEEAYKPSVASSSHTTFIHPFYFDPNTLDAEGWQRLGVRPKTIQTIMNYRSKGGKFRHAEDIRKVYGLRKQEAETLIPFVRIVSPTKQEYTQREEYAVANPTTTQQEDVRPILKSARPIRSVEINTASPEEWKALPGIGDVLSARIVRFRDKLGGFISIEQVHKTYGISDSTFALIRPYLHLSADSRIKQININTATEQELGGHPFIGRGIAKAVISLRDKMGQFKSVSDIRKLSFISDEMFANMAPYLTVD